MFFRDSSSPRGSPIDDLDSQPFDPSLRARRTHVYVHTHTRARARATPLAAPVSLIARLSQNPPRGGPTDLETSVFPARGGAVYTRRSGTAERTAITRAACVARHALPRVRSTKIKSRERPAHVWRRDVATRNQAAKRPRGQTPPMLARSLVLRSDPLVRFTARRKNHRAPPRAARD